MIERKLVFNYISWFNWISSIDRLFDSKNWRNFRFWEIKSITTCTFEPGTTKLLTKMYQLVQWLSNQNGSVKSGIVTSGLSIFMVGFLDCTWAFFRRTFETNEPIHIRCILVSCQLRTPWFGTDALIFLIQCEDRDRHLHTLSSKKLQFDQWPFWDSVKPKSLN